MALTSALAIYFLFWMMSAFILLPFGVRTHDDVGAPTVSGQITSAPVNFNPKRLAIRATWLSLALFGLYYLNYVMDWLTIEDIDISRYL